MTKIFQPWVIAFLVFVILPVDSPAQVDKAAKDNQVIIYAAVNNKSNQPVSGLRQENFKAYEGKKEKTITYFSDTNEPASVGFMLDISGSMTFKKSLPFTRMISRFTKSANADDEYFALTFSASAKITNFSNDSKSFLEKVEELTSQAPKGETKFFDAMRSAIEAMGGAKYKKKAIIIISDLGDNESKTKFDQLKWMFRESDVIVYLICVNSDELAYAAGRLRFLELVELRGGVAFFPVDTKEIGEVLERISLDLRSRYAIGFEPSFSRKKDQDEWRTIDFKVEVPNMKKEKYLVTAPVGYYAPRKK